MFTTPPARHKHEYVEFHSFKFILSMISLLAEKWRIMFLYTAEKAVSIIPDQLDNWNTTLVHVRKYNPTVYYLLVCPDRFFPESL
jgi:hypothetical protein